MTEPGTDNLLATVSLANAEDSGVSALQAAKIQNSWATLGGRERAAILRQAASILERDCESIALVLVRESGSILPMAQMEVRESIELLHAAAAPAIAPRGEVLSNPPGRLSYARRVPRGVIGII